MCGDLYTFRSPTKPAIICGSLVPVPLPSLGGPAGHKPRPSLEETSAHSIYFPSCAGSYQRVWLQETSDTYSSGGIAAWELR